MLITARKHRRKFWLLLHRYLGLFAGAIFVIIGLTGSLLAFEHPLDEWLNTNMMTVNRPATPVRASLDAIVSAGLRAMPFGAKAINLDYPRHEGLAFALWFEQTSPGRDYPERHQIFIDPYRAQVTGQRLLIDFHRIWRDPLLDFVLRLHYSLGFGENGMTLVGWVGIAMLLSVLAGLIVWWPLTGKFRSALTFKPKASRERLVYDLHKVCGIYGSIVLVVLIATGIYLAFPSYGRDLIGLFSPVASPWPEYSSQSPPHTNSPKTLRLTELEAIVDTNFPDGEFRYIVFPSDESGSYEIGKRAPDEPNRMQTQRRIWIDQYNGKVLAIRDRSSRSSGDAFVEWLYPLHTGEAFGLPGCFIVLIAGLFPASLYITGYIRWRQKKRHKLGLRRVR
ncbi:PepSY-associated TM helix domain-containing protein [Methylomonas sp. UP202]|uniref:PepSY-associated TM helix domain-containing protein n=1 Tax=Methylomonas sp. UP202 TaxID=3040943 RepID=UPI00247AA692|nr:PepSY-associated TM helix domain-containing protein [Methylomonas sp. UP202]WGS85476.1 PepSY-associated TM helix domain-containing protein [Methylomonas sp. UP202]